MREVLKHCALATEVSDGDLTVHDGVGSAGVPHLDDVDEADGWQIDIPTEPLSIKMSRSGQWAVLLDGDQTARVYASRTGVLALEVPYEGLPSVDFSSSGDRMLLFNDRGEVLVYRIRDGAILSVIQLERGAEILEARFANDNAIITVSKDLVARTWNVPDEPPVPGTVSNLRPCRDGKLVPVTPWPADDSIWAPEDQCDGFTSPTPSVASSP